MIKGMPTGARTGGRAVSRSRAAALRVALGIALGTAICGAVGSLGIVLLFSAAPWLYLTLKLLGGAYLIYLGVRLLTGAGRAATGPNPDPGRSAARPLAELRLGPLTNLADPKTALFVASLFAWVLPAGPTAALAPASAGVRVGLSIGR